MNTPAAPERSYGKGRALFIVAGKQIGKLYLAEGDTMHEIALIKEPKQWYSDNEGFFARGGSGHSYAAGAVREPKDTETKRKFLRKLGKEVKALANQTKIEAVYLFAPDYAITELKEELPQEMTKRIRFSFRGNFVKFGRGKLLAKLEEKFFGVKEQNQSWSDEELKILKRPRTTGNPT